MSEQTVDHKPVYNINGANPITIIKAKGEINEVDIDISGKNGFRVKWYDPYKCTVEMKNSNGDWVEISGIQKMIISMSAREPLPHISMEIIALPGVKGEAVQSFFVDEAAKT